MSEDNQPAISPTEDLMREHGVLRRILLIYDEVKYQLQCEDLFRESFIYPIVIDTAQIARRFIENYHQKLEEKYVFSEFLREQLCVKLVDTLLEQHMAASELTKMIIHSARMACHPFELCQLLSSYNRMYEPHSAREDTVVFPAFRRLVSPDRLDQLGQIFEEIEEQKFGEHGFRNIVNHVAQIEKALGIYDLSQFTPSFNQAESHLGKGLYG
jgi:hemerythrin-like domain-containing protein